MEASCEGGQGPEGAVALWMDGWMDLSLRVPSKGAPSMLPNRVPHGQGYSITRATGLLIHSFVHSCMSAGVLKKEPSYIHMRKNIRSPSMEPHADGRPTYNGVQPGSPRVSLTTLLSLPQCHAAFGRIPSTLAWVDQSLVSQHVSWQPLSGYTVHNCYRLPRDPG